MKKGFTLVELLGVIVILSMISVIITPSIIDYVNKSKTSAYRTSVQSVIDQAKEYVSKNEVNNDFPEGGINIIETDLNLKKDKFVNGIIERNEEGEIVAVNVYDGTYCANGTKDNLVVEKVKSLEECNKIDTTAPTLKVKAVEVTSNKIIVVALAKDEQSGIKNYKYCIGEECYDNIERNNYEFSGLKSGQTYEITVTVRNNNSGKDEQYTSEITEKEVKIKVTTLSIEEPTFEISSSSYAGSKEITIKYGIIREGYEYGYEFIDENGNKETKVVTNSEEKVEITKNGTLKAYIRKDEEEVSNEITLIGIDSIGPEVYVIMNDKWEKNKQIKIIAKDKGSGLSSKSYSYDGGKSWTSNNVRTYTENTKVELVVRDKIGNKTSKYKICTDETLNNCYEAENIIINKIDTTEPTCILKGNGIEGTTNWFRSDVTMEIIVSDKQLDGEGNEIEGSGVVKQSIDKEYINVDGKYTVTGTVEDALGNKGTCSIDVGRDTIAPTIEITMSGTKQGSGYQSGAKAKITCTDENEGVNGNRTDTLTAKGTNTVNGTCTDIAGNTASDSKDYLIYVNSKDASCGYATCQNSACGVASTVYKSCADSACGTYQYACGTYQYACGTYNCNCTTVNTSCKTYGCYLYKSCWYNCYNINLKTCKQIEGKTYVSGKGCCGSYGRNSSCGSEYVTGSACNNANSKSCIAYNTATQCQSCTSYCTGTNYCTGNNTCRNSACGVEYYVYNSCQTAACGYATCWHT